MRAPVLAKQPAQRVIGRGVAGAGADGGVLRGGGLMTADGTQVTELIDLRSADDWSGAGRRNQDPRGKCWRAWWPTRGSDGSGWRR